MGKGARRAHKVFPGVTVGRLSYALSYPEKKRTAYEILTPQELDKVREIQSCIRV